MRQLLFLGTGNGMPIASACSSIFIEDDKNNLLLDAGGGHDILAQFHKAKKDPTTIKNIFYNYLQAPYVS